MTPSMQLSELIKTYADHPDKDRITRDLHKAMSFGHKFGLDRAANAVPRRFYTAKQAIKLLKVAEVQDDAPVIEEDFT